MSFPRPTPINAWGEKPGPKRIAEERPPEEEKEEVFPVPATSPPTGEEGADNPAEAREALSFARSCIRNLGKVPEYVRSFGHATFQAMRERRAERDERYRALVCLVPTLMHLRDDSPTVVEDSWNTLKRLAVLLGERKLEPLLRTRNESRVCLVMAKRFRKVPECHFLLQVILHTSSTKASIREAAVRMLGFIGTDTEDQRKLAVIHMVLRNAATDRNPLVRSSARETIVLLEALHARRSFREQLRCLFGPCC